MKKIKVLFSLLFLAIIGSSHTAMTEARQFYVLKLKAHNSFQRSLIANTGAAIEFVKDDYVIATALLEEKAKLERMGVLLEDVTSKFQPLNFPQEDSQYHDYSELTQKLQELHQRFPQITKMGSAGRSLEGRELWNFVVRGNPDTNQKVPQIIFIGGHHAREHLSLETPLRLLEWLLDEYQKGNPRIRGLVDHREIHFIPAVNPDGLEYDIESANYKMWRKNRSRNSDGSFGVDLNRNYGYKWGTGGSSASPRSDTYKGPTPFSEPETQAIKSYVESLKEAKILLSFHTFSELILYPWGHTHEKIQNDKDFQVYKKMAEKMAEWNRYTPEQSSDLYIASGDTTDWSYGTLGLFSFTFELDPRDQWTGGGFYPGDEVIQNVVDKNKEPFLYLIEYADNPYRVLDFNIGH